MTGRYEHFFGLVMKYDTFRKDRDRQNALLMQRMARSVQDVALQDDLKKYYASCYVYPDQSVYFQREHEQYGVCAEVMNCLDRDGINNSHVARWCSVSKAQITAWKNGTMPNKYAWWMIALHTKMPLKMLPAFLAMVGCGYDPFCRQDVIMLHGQYMGYSVIEILRQLDENECPIGIKRESVYRS